MKTKIKARKKTIINWIEAKFGSLEMLAAAGGIDTSVPEVRALLKQVRTSREPVVLSIRWRNVVLEINLEHSSAAGVPVIAAGVNPFAGMLPSPDEAMDDEEPVT